MASFKQYTASGGASEAFSINTFSSDEIKVYVDNVLKTPTTHYNITSYTANGGTVTWTAGNVPASGTVRIVRDTDVTTARATYAAGSSIKAGDLNDNQTQALRSLEEQDDQLIQTYDVENKAITSAKLDTNIDIAGTLDVTGATTLDSTLNVALAATFDEDILAKDAAVFQHDVNIKSDNKTFTIENASGTDKFTVATGTGNTTIAGTLAAGTTTVTGNIAVSGTVDGRDVAADGTKLDTIESNATADQSNTEIRAAVEAASDSNVFTDADHSKLNAIEASATADQTDAEIRAAVEAATNSNVFTDADHTKLNAAATLTGSETLTNKTLTTPVINDMSGTAVVTSGTSTSDNKVYSAKRADEKYYQKGSADDIEASGVPWSGNDSTVATTAAIDKRIVDIVDDVGGFVALTDEGEIPQYHPEKENTDTADRIGTILSIGTLTTTYTPSTGTCTIQASDLTNHAVNATITDCGSTVLSAGFGVLVETKAQTDAQYAAGPSFKFHRLVPKATEVTAVAGKATEIGRLGTAAAVEDLGILGTTAIVSDLDTLADISSNITTVAGVSSNVTTVAGISSDVTTVASNNSNVTAVGGKATEIGRLGTADAVADLALLGTTAVVEDLNLLGTSAAVADMALLGDSAVIADMATIADTSNLITNIGTVAGIQANVTTVAGNSSNVTTVASNMSTVNDFAARYRTATNNSGEYSSNNDIGDLYFNTDINALKVWNGSAWVAGVTSTGDYAVTTGDTFTGNLKLNDSVELRIGTGDDLKIYHNGSHSYIDENGTGILAIRSNGTEVAIASVSGESMGRFINDGAVELYYDNALKLQTASTGVTVTGNVVPAADSTHDLGTNGVRWNAIYGDTISGNLYGNGANITVLNIVVDTSPQLGGNLDVNTKNILFGDSASASDDRLIFGASSDLQIYHDGTNSILTNSTGVFLLDGDDIRLRSAGGENYLRGIANGAVELYHDNVKKFETTSAGIQVTDSDTNVVVKLETSSGTAGYLYGAGNTECGIQDAQGHNAVLVTKDAATELYYDNSKKLETTSAGVTVTGTLTADLADNSIGSEHIEVQDGDLQFVDGAKIRLGTSNDLEIWHQAGSYSYIQDSFGSLRIESDVIHLRSKTGYESYLKGTLNGAVELYYDNSKKFETTSYGVYSAGMGQFDDGIKLIDSQVARFGTGNDLQIYHDGGSSVIRNINNNASLYLQASSEGTNNIRCYANGGTVIYWNGEINLYTEEDAVRINDNTKLELGNASDLQIYHDGTDSILKNSTGTLSIRGAIVSGENAAGTENTFYAVENGAFSAYYDNVKKFETTSDGATVTGRLLTDSASIGTTNTNSTLTINAGGANNAVSIRNTGGGNSHVGILFSTQDHSGGREKAAIFHHETHGAAHYGGDIAFCLNTATGGATQVGLSDRKATITRHGGMCFGTDTADANCLDDYEEGTHTATITIGSGSISNTHSNTLTYTKIGRVVHVVGRLYHTFSQTNVTTWQTSLPFTSNGGGHAVESSSVVKVFRANEHSNEANTGTRAIRVESGNAYANMVFNTHSNGGDFGTTNPHIIFNLTYYA